MWFKIFTISHRKEKICHQGFIHTIVTDDKQCFMYTEFPDGALQHEIYEWILPRARNIKLLDGSCCTSDLPKRKPRTMLTVGRNAPYPCKNKAWLWLRVWLRSGGSYGNNTRVICCPAQRRPKSAARGTSPPDNKSRGCCCRNSRPTVINPDYNMNKQRCMKRIYDKIHPKSPPNLVTSPTCLHCDVTHLCLTTGVVVLYIPSWRIEVREERRQARKIVWPINAGRVICRYHNNLCGIINHHKHIRYCFLDV